MFIILATYYSQELEFNSFVNPLIKCIIAP